MKLDIITKESRSSSGMVDAIKNERRCPFSLAGVVKKESRSPSGMLNIRQEMHISYDK